MFTGIIENIGKIKKIEKNLFTISHNFKEPFKKGESITLSGMCSTIINFDAHSFTVEIMEESRNCTIFGKAKMGDLVNLERAERTNNRNSGHFVLGHIDEVGKILFRKKPSDFELFRISISPKNAALCVFKGSISIDGISLTISNLDKDWIEVSIISHTLKNTNLETKDKGDSVNLEFDILGKYILRNEDLKKL